MEGLIFTGRLMSPHLRPCICARRSVGFITEVYELLGKPTIGAEMNGRYQRG